MAKFISIRRFCEEFGVGRTRCYELIGSGAIRAVKAGARTLVCVDSAMAWAATLPAMGARGAERSKVDQ